ncbi:MAG: PKD domain-containing protein, partial [Bacteroidetes bacterium]|nr:PKD domain-containing protein [Bacteroidota bacterium]
MRTLPTLVAGLGLAVSAAAQWPCDSLVQASFIASPGPDGTVHFQNTSAGTPAPTSWYWSFGDGGTSTLASPAHTYTQPGTYTACLVLVSGNCFDSTCTALTIGSGPSPCDGLNAGFQVTTDGLEASFHTSGSPNGQVYSWSFGDGTSGQGPAPAHTYASGGQYHACLTVWTWDPATQDTCFADHCEWVVVQ